MLVIKPLREKGTYSYIKNMRYKVVYMNIERDK